MRRYALVLAAIAVLGLAAACADDGDDPGILPDVVPSNDAGPTPLDATLGGSDVGPEPVADAEPPAGDTCGDRAGLQGSSWPLAGGCPTRAGVTTLGAPRFAASSIFFPYAGSASAPVVGVDARMWVGSKDGVVYAIGPGSGSSFARRIGASEITSSAALAANGNAIIGSPDGQLYAFTTLPEAPDLDAGDAGDAAPDAGGGEVVGTQLLRIVWSLDLGAPIRSSPVIGPDSTIYVGTTNGKLVAAKQTPAIQWTATTGDTFGSSPALSRDGTVYVGSTDHKLYAFTAATGAPKWATDVGAEIASSPAVGGDGTIYVGSKDGKLHAITAAGAIKWTYAAAGPLVGTPAVYAGGVYMASEDKSVHGVNVVDGSVRWTFQTLGTPTSPMVTEAGNVIFGSSDARVYVLTPKGGLLFAVLAKGTVTSGAAMTSQSLAAFATDKGLSLVGQ